jgi:hypothetical protein
MRPGRPVAKPRQAFTPVSIDPFADCPRANACGLRDGLRRLPALDLLQFALERGASQPGILMNVHPILRESLKLRQPQSSRLGSYGQPMETSQLVRAPSGPRQLEATSEPAFFVFVAALPIFSNRSTHTRAQPE